MDIIGDFWILVMSLISLVLKLLETLPNYLAISDFYIIVDSLDSWRPNNSWRLLKTLGDFRFLRLFHWSLLETFRFFGD